MKSTNVLIGTPFVRYRPKLSMILVLFLTDDEEDAKSSAHFIMMN